MSVNIPKIYIYLYILIIYKAHGTLKCHTTMHSLDLLFIVFQFFFKLCILNLTLLFTHNCMLRFGLFETQVRIPVNLVNLVEGMGRLQRNTTLSHRVTKCSTVVELHNWLDKRGRNITWHCRTVSKGCVGPLLSGAWNTDQLKPNVPFSSILKCIIGDTLAEMLPWQ